MTDQTDVARILDLLLHRQAGDLPISGGRTLAYIYDSGEASIEELGREAVAAYAGSNGLDPTAFPSLLAMENELVGFALSMIEAPATAVGSVTSGGTESVLLAVQTAREARPDIAEPEMVLPTTAHAAFHKAAHYFGVRLVLVPVGNDFRADAGAMAAAITERTVLLVASAPSYAHGVIDPVAEIAEAARLAGVRCHVDACIGGWVLPWAERLGRRVRPWTFAVDGVTSISLDTHKYAYAPKGTSLLLYVDAEARRPQLFASGRWPGYTMVNSTMQSTRSGGPLAGAWSVVHALGESGYLRLTERVLTTVEAIRHGVGEIAGIDLVAEPDSTLLCLSCDDSCDPFTIADGMRARGWFVQPQFSFENSPANLHLTISAATPAAELLAALGESVNEARTRGRIRVDPAIGSIIQSLDPATLSAADFDGLLTAAGLIGPAWSGEASGLALPERMAEVNAMLEIATPALREALLGAFLDRLLTPARTSR